MMFMERQGPVSRRVTIMPAHRPAHAAVPGLVALAGWLTATALSFRAPQPVSLSQFEVAHGLLRAGPSTAMIIVVTGAAILFAFLLRFVQQEKRRAAQVTTAHRDLEREMSQRAVIERALRESEQRYRDLAERSLGYIGIHDFEGRLLMVNAAAAEALGYSPDDMVGRELSAFLAESSRPGVRAYLDHMRVHAEMRGTVTLITRTGEERIWSFSNTLYTEADKPIYVLANAQDITALKEAEAELAEARDAAVESARLKSEFLANMSHEIRTPLNGVIGMTDLLMTSALSGEQREYAETVRASADSLLTIVNDILDFSKIEAGMLAFETLDFGLRNLVESTVEMFGEPAKRKKIEMATLVYSDVPDQLRGDPGRVRQVLTNLVGNAVKFTLAGEVTLQVTVREQTGDSSLIHFAITDTGIGISAEQQERLFQPFVQADGSTARQFGGTGLGLAISKQLVQRMDGEIGVDSEPGVGSTFWFTARLERQPPRVKGAGVDATLDGLRVLIIDDNETNRTVVNHYVTAWGMEPDEAVGGAEALGRLRDAHAAGRPIDIALLDLMMPGMTGFELARRIKKDPALRDTRLVLMPSFGKRGHATDAREAGISAYLVKPVRQAELRDCLLTIVNEPLDSTQGAKLVTRHSLVERGHRPPRRILIAEDNLVNQKVLMAQVSKLGYRADLVNNGEEALAAMERYKYALVLMDCHMPRMDGYEASRRIRENEGDARHTPIIAITANALAGEREKCIAAGMDDYLTKPLKQEDLGCAVEKWMPADHEEAPTRSGFRGDAGIIFRVSDPGTGVTSNPHFLSRAYVGGGMQNGLANVRHRVNELRAEIGVEVLGSLIEMFLADAMSRIEKLRREIARHDAAGVQATAHALKGSCLNFGAEHMAELCQEMEDRGEQGRLDGVPALIEQVESAFEAVRDELEAVVPVV